MDSDQIERRKASEEKEHDNGKSRMAHECQTCDSISSPTPNKINSGKGWPLAQRSISMVS